MEFAANCSTMDLSQNAPQWVSPTNVQHGLLLGAKVKTITNAQQRVSHEA